MTVRVHLQSKTGSWSEEIGTFTCEEYYEVCIKALETWAKKNGHIITESVEEENAELDLGVGWDSCNETAWLELEWHFEDYNLEMVRI